MKLVRIVVTGSFMLLASGAALATDAKRFQPEEASISDVQAAYRSGATTATRVAAGRTCGRDSGRAQRQSRIGDGVSVYCCPRGLFLANVDGHARHPGGY